MKLGLTSTAIALCAGLLTACGSQSSQDSNVKLVPAAFQIKMNFNYEKQVKSLDNSVIKNWSSDQSRCLEFVVLDQFVNGKPVKVPALEWKACEIAPIGAKISNLNQLWIDDPYVGKTWSAGSKKTFGTTMYLAKVVDGIGGGSNLAPVAGYQNGIYLIGSNSYALVNEGANHFAPNFSLADVQASIKGDLDVYKNGQVLTSTRAPVALPGVAALIQYNSRSDKIDGTFTCVRTRDVYSTELRIDLAPIAKGECADIRYDNHGKRDDYSL